ncbi:hypothetical protein HELRODRAFT_76554 [Helobdella robusta]|uniref:t-SNARE coiled-coil homology domain-containing protein n=1 Tax=Helobdella robusta TaxID=6412 RepID=T1G2L5_HELRO|nr:hypothetical protein HELRODRAFT_76554 [Helobdella robusta]ESO07232.1 hypothetical protein HELRODRAFT_76554 [Helobdella robusta]
MESLYHQTNKLLMDVQSRLSVFEKLLLNTGNETDSNAMEIQIKADINKIYDSCDRLDLMVNKEPPSRKANAKLRVDQIKYDCRHLQSALQNIINRKVQKQEESRAREMLLKRTFTTNDPDTSILIDDSLQHNQRAQSSIKEIDELIYTGNSILSNLRDQGGMLKSVQKKVLDIGNMLGLSNTVMRMIERRTSQDWMIFFGGMIVTCIVIIVTVLYLRR